MTIRSRSLAICVAVNLAVVVIAPVAQNPTCKEARNHCRSG